MSFSHFTQSGLAIVGFLMRIVVGEVAEEFAVHRFEVGGRGGGILERCCLAWQGGVETEQIDCARQGRKI